MRIKDMDLPNYLFEIKQEMLHDAINGVRALNINGINITIPYKLKVMDFIDSISDEAERIGAVNTIHNFNGLLSGYNTDYIGFGRMLKRNSIDIKNKTAAVLGTGGAAKSVVTYLADNGASNIYIISRNPERVQTFNRELYEIIDYRKLSTYINTDLLINCTPCGMHPDIYCSPIDETCTTHFGTVVDLIYNPSETLLLKYADKYGIKAVNGLYMLVAQATAAVEIWTDQKIENSIVEDVFKNLKLNFNK
jgi:shikimate dehydrogenase